MSGSISKYFGMSSDEEGRPLFWGASEYPFRGPPPLMLKGEEIDQIPLVYEAKSDILELPKDRERYDQIIDKCANGLWQLRHEKFFEFDQTNKSVTVFIAWLEIYGQTPRNPDGWETVRHAQST